jgi:hypothetical protein
MKQADLGDMFKKGFQECLVHQPLWHLLIPSLLLHQLHVQRLQQAKTLRTVNQKMKEISKKNISIIFIKITLNYIEIKEYSYD